MEGKVPQRFCKSVIGTNATCQIIFRLCRFLTMIPNVGKLLKFSFFTGSCFNDANTICAQLVGGYRISRKFILYGYIV